MSKRLGCENCGKPHEKGHKFVYLFKEHIKLCSDCATSWRTYHHGHPQYLQSLVRPRIHDKIWAEWVNYEEAKSHPDKPEKVILS